MSSRHLSFRASQLLLQRFCVSRRVYARRSMFHDEHMNLYTIFKSAQLFERFRALQRRRFPLHEIKQCFAPQTVNALMAKILDRNRATAREGERIAREVKRIAIKIDNHLHLMRRGGRSFALEWMRGGDDVDLAIGLKRFDHPIEQSRFSER